MVRSQFEAASAVSALQYCITVGAQRIGDQGAKSLVVFDD
jgi:hypothetical protein